MHHIPTHFNGVICTHLFAESRSESTEVTLFEVLWRANLAPEHTYKAKKVR
jgi:hypothetical protein